MPSVEAQLLTNVIAGSSPVSPSDDIQKSVIRGGVSQNGNGASQLMMKRWRKPHAS